MEEIRVYKTNASENTDLSHLAGLLGKLPGIRDWNFDFEDRDNIFRVVSVGVPARRLESLLAEAGIRATELDDSCAKRPYPYSGDYSSEE